MYLSRCNPKAVTKSYNDLDSFLESFFNAGPTWNLSQGTRARENDDAYTVQIDLPGVSKDKVKLRVENDIVNIKASRQDSFDGKEEKAYEINRSFYLPDNVDTNKIEASINDGILKINLPKKEQAKPKDIEVKVK